MLYSGFREKQACFAAISISPIARMGVVDHPKTGQEYTRNNVMTLTAMHSRRHVGQGTEDQGTEYQPSADLSDPGLLTTAAAAAG